MTTTEADGATGVLAGEERLLIDGELAGAAGGATFDVINPPCVRRQRRELAR